MSEKTKETRATRFKSRMIESGHKQRSFWLDEKSDNEIASLKRKLQVSNKDSAVKVAISICDSLSEEELRFLKGRVN